MNCLDKMYKEIEEILKREEQEAEKSKFQVKEIKRAFLSGDEPEIETAKREPRNYLSEIAYDSDKWTVKRFDEERAKTFIEFVFKKFFCFFADSFGDGEKDAILTSLKGDLEGANNLFDIFTAKENAVIDMLEGDDAEEAEKFFLNPYHGLFKDETGYFAVVENGKFSDVKRPLGFNANQMRKVIKETFDEYLEDFKERFSGKEVNAFINSVKADLNKSEERDPIKLEEFMIEKLAAGLKKKGVSIDAFTAYLNSKGLRFIKQGNFYYYKGAYEKYAEYKKIEFRY